MDDARLGLVLRALRRRRGWRQQDLAENAGVSQSTVSRMERGHLDDLQLRTVRRVFAALEVRTGVEARWRGGPVERLADERHAHLGTRMVRLFTSLGWQVFPEVTYQHFGERGSIDLLGLNRAADAVVVTELKSVVASYEETQRRLDAKARLAATITFQRFGWRPRIVGVILVVEYTSSNRRRLAALTGLVRAGLPDDGRTARRWLRQPTGALRALWFLPLMHPRTARHGRIRRLVPRRSTSTSPAAPPSVDAA